MKKVLLAVDDDQGMLHQIKKGLEKIDASYFVLTASDGLAALEQLENNVVALIIADLKMPRMDGITLLSNLSENYPEIPVIIITAHSTPEMEKFAKDNGAVAYLTKPIGIRTLASQIKSALRKEAEGGTLHSVSSGTFLQMIEMEQRTCTIRLEDSKTGNQGVLFFKEGELLDARQNHLRTKAAIYEIFSWEEVSLQIQDSCPSKPKKIDGDLQSLLLEAMRRKDESGEDGLDRDANPSAAESQTDFIASIRKKLHARCGDRCGLEDIYQDNSWDSFISKATGIGSFFKSGRLKLAYINRGEPQDYIILPGESTTVVSIDRAGLRDSIIQALIT
ncbi:MAG: response regulator [Desulfobacterales bacterium]|nr:response regulator [Desulfobacterales bacterium]